MLDRYLVALHVCANLVWIGALLAVVVIAVSQPTYPGKEMLSRTLPTGRQPGSPVSIRHRPELARIVYTRLAVPAFVVSFVAGVVPLVLGASHYFVATKFMHGKLPLAIGAIVLHHVIGAHARSPGAARHDRKREARLATLGWSFFGCAMGAAALAVLKPF